MDSASINRLIDIVEQPCDLEEDQIATAILLFLLVLQCPDTYKAKKARPVSELRQLVHWAALGFRPTANRLAPRGGFALKGNVSIARELGQDGKFVLKCDSLIPPRTEAPPPSFEFDVCISFAGEQRSLAEEIATKLRDHYHLRVFYDDFEKTKLWGRDLFNHLYETYSVKSQYCLVLFSEAYLKKNWTVHELRAAQARIVKERSAYVLPLICESGVSPPREFENISYLSFDAGTVEMICEEINDRVWEPKRDHWLVVEEAAELINDGFQFRMFISAFRDHAATNIPERDALLTLLVGIIWVSSQDKVVPAINGFIDYLLFAFPPLALMFDEDDTFLVLPPDGSVRRTLDESGGSLLMPAAYLHKMVEPWRENYPQMFGGGEEDDNKEFDDDDSEDKGEQSAGGNSGGLDVGE